MDDSTNGTKLRDGDDLTSDRSPLETEDHTLHDLVDPGSKTQPAEGGRDEVDADAPVEHDAASPDEWSREGGPNQDG